MRLTVKHALGQKTYDLRPCPIDEPVIIGRDSRADVQIPSISIRKQHAVLFYHDGQWILEAKKSVEGTMVNGVAVAAAVKLAVGDRVSLGDASAGNEIEVVSLDDADAVTAVEEDVSPSASAVVGEVDDETEAINADTFTTQTTGTSDTNEIFDPADTAEANSLAASASSTTARANRRRTPGKRAKAEGLSLLTMAAIFLVILSVVGISWAVWRMKKQLALADKPAEPVELPKVEQAPAQGRRTIFETAKTPAKAPAGSTTGSGATPDRSAPTIAGRSPVKTTDNVSGQGRRPGPGDETVPSNGGRGTPPTDIVPPAGPADPAGGDGAATNPPEPTPADGPRNTPEWIRVVDAEISASAVTALYVYMEYEKANAQSPLLGELESKKQQMLDRLWWERINSLVDQQQSMTTTISDLQTEKKAAESDGSPKVRLKQFDQQIEDLQGKMAVNKLLLHDSLGYDENKKVDVDDAAGLKKLRAGRDAVKFKGWSNDVQQRIWQSRGGRAF